MRSANALATMRQATKARVNDPHEVVSQGLVDSVYREMRNRSITFRLLTGERVCETLLAKELGVSRTPVREALKLLTYETFLTHSAKQGFFRKPLDAKEIFDLYEFRKQLAMAAVQLAMDRVTYEQLLELECFTQKASEKNTSTLEELTSQDEEFHERLVTLSGNIEMLNSFRKLYDHIRYVRGIDIDGRRLEILAQYMEIVRSLRERNTEEGMRLMDENIGLRMDQVKDMIGRCYGRIYMTAELQSNSRVPTSSSRELRICKENEEPSGGLRNS